ncbi:hypothetical protein HOL46_00815 [Candidatus Falkowbacteria bacterium]|jgi:hypothetical protein|nr:hypothetical protein [Candidatus Falkowbacteria bacterium]
MKLKLRLIYFFRPFSFIALILANIFVIKNPYLGVVVAGILIFFYGQRLGHKIFATSDRFFQTLYGSLAFVGINSIILWISFYLYNLEPLTVIRALIITTIPLEYFTPKFIRPKFNLKQFFSDYIVKLKPKFLIFGFLIFVLVNFMLLFKFRTDQAITSPWNIVSKDFFVFFIVLTILLVIILIKNQNILVSKILLIIYTALFSSVALIIYKIGYGYDPFLHLAAMKQIMATSTLIPKTFYYIGEYSVVIFLHNITQLPLEFINKLFLPLSMAILLPTSIYYGLTTGLKLNKNYSLTACLGSLILPITYFIHTTPQGLTNLLCLIIIFLSFIKHKSMLKFLLFLSIITLTIHPLFGAPILVFVIYLFSQNIINAKVKKATQTVLILGSLFVFPILFILNSWLNNLKVSLLKFNLSQLFDFTLFHSEHKFRFIYDLIYVYGFNIKIIFLILAGCGLLLMLFKKEFAKYKVHFGAGIVIFVNFLLTKVFLNFEFATNQNQAQFMSRISELSLYFLLPIVIYLFYNLIQFNFDKQGNFAGKLFVLLLLTLITSTSLYFSYPVKDDYKDSQEYNVTKGDVEAVQLIDQKTEGDYIVLGNQMLAAAAIREFGFAHYYNQDFYYSIPNGNDNNLYQYYKKLVFEKVDRDFIDQAMSQANVDQAYFVLNDYWSNSEKLIPQSKFMSDNYYTTDKGSNHIFYFQKK